VRLLLEQLERRDVPAGGTGTSLLAPFPEPSDTLLDAGDLGALQPGSALAVPGRVGLSGADSSAPQREGTRDVDWYQFTLAAPMHVVLASSFGVLSLYNSDPFNYGDPFNNLGHRLLGQGGELAQDLAAGTYYVSVSGAGNLYFNPLLAGSGYAGDVGDYRLTVQASALDLPDGPALLSTTPTAGAVLDASPLCLRLVFSAQLDPASVSPDSNVILTWWPAAGPAAEQQLSLSGYNYSDATNELQLFLSAPLAPGTYHLLVIGNTQHLLPGADPQDPYYVAPVTGRDGTPLGYDSSHPQGQDYSLGFTVAGVEGADRPDDTPAGAHDLGDITHTARVQVAQAIGNDPTDPTPFNPADVDLYHFTVSGDGRYAFAAEVFARRLGSSLNPAVTLFRLDPVTGDLVPVASNDNTGNTTETANHSTAPLFSDAVIFAGLTAGDYYVAVTSTGNLPGEDGAFDPAASHSGTAGETVGDYVLNLGLTRDDVAPEVVSATPGGQGFGGVSPPTLPSVLDAPPAYLTVRFSEAVNVQELAYRAFETTHQGDIRPVWVEGEGGAVYFPRLVSFDDRTNEATFLMLQGLPNGSYRLHLSGALGLTDLAGNPLVGNDPETGDYVVAFSVAAAPRGANGDPHLWQFTDPASSDESPIEVGVLFPLELVDGVTVKRDFTDSTSGGFVDYYRITVLQNQNYVLLPGEGDLSGAVTYTVIDSAGNVVETAPQGEGNGVLAILEAGTYLLRVEGERDGSPAQAGYQFILLLDGGSDNAPALTVGPSPVLRLRPALEAPAPTANAPATPIEPTLATHPAGDAVNNLASVALALVPNEVYLGLANGPAGVQVGRLERAAPVQGGPTWLAGDRILDAALLLFGVTPMLGGDDSSDAPAPAAPSEAPTAAAPPKEVRKAEVRKEEASPVKDASWEPTAPPASRAVALAEVWDSWEDDAAEEAGEAPHALSAGRTWVSAILALGIVIGVVGWRWLPPQRAFRGRLLQSPKAAP
jgi:hypothetical protein